MCANLTQSEAKSEIPQPKCVTDSWDLGPESRQITLRVFGNLRAIYDAADSWAFAAGMTNLAFKLGPIGS